VLSRALKRLDEDVPYHASLFGDPTSLRTLSKIEEMRLPQELRYLGDELLDALIGDVIYESLIIISSDCDCYGATLLRTLSRIEEVGLPQELCYLDDELLHALPCDIEIVLITANMNTIDDDCN